MQFGRMGTRLSLVLVSADMLPTMRTVVPKQCGLVACELNSRPVVRVTCKQTVCSSTKTHVHAVHAVAALVNTPENNNKKKSSFL